MKRRVSAPSVAVAVPSDAEAGRGSALIETAAGPIEYAVEGAGHPLLSIHGAGGGFDQGLANARELVGDGFRVVAPSRFGYLRTPVPKDVSPAAQAAAHAALLTALGITSATVLGVSAGARSAVELALRRPDLVAALILVVPALYSPSSPVAVESSSTSQLAFRMVNAGMDFVWWAAQRVMPSMLVRFMGVPPALFAALPPGARDRVLRIVGSVQPLSRRAAGIRIDSAAELHDLPLERVSAPTLVMSARDDLFNTVPAAEFAAAQIPGAALIIYETGGHLLAGREADARAAARAFLAKLRLIPFLRMISNDALPIRQRRAGRLAQVNASDE
jgi:pimeloyl-ACP methyl ester carboxylesterase